MGLQHCATDPNSSNLAPNFEGKLEGFFHFLSKTRGGEHPFYLAFKKAYDLVH